MSNQKTQATVIESNESKALDKAREYTSPVAFYLAGLKAGNSRRTMESALRGIIAVMDGRQSADEVTRVELARYPFHALDVAMMQLIRSTLAERYSPKHANKSLTALRGVLKAAWKLEQITGDDYLRLTDVKRIEGSRLPTGRDLSSGEVAALSRACQADESPAGIRDEAMIAVAFYTGVRVSELIALNLEDYNMATGDVKILRAKGNKDREVNILNGAKEALDDWLTIRGNEPGPMFWPINKSGVMKAGRLSTNSLRVMLEKRRKQAGVSGLTFHDFRRTYAGDQLDAGTDIATIADNLGHASVETTRRYDRRGLERIRKAGAKRNWPREQRERRVAVTA